MVKKEDSYSITNLTKRSVPKIQIEKIKNKILGKKYSLSIVFVGDVRMKRLNKEYRKKDKTSNVLSFEISNVSGEIFINLPMAIRTSKKNKVSLKKELEFLLIHGILHLSGYEHGVVMEKMEDKLISSI